MQRSTFKKLIFLTLAVLTFFQVVHSPGVFAHEVNKSAIALLVAKDPSGRMTGTGTGFIVGPEGTLVTNYHVLVDAAAVEAVFPDGSKSPIVGIVKIDREKDFAVLKLKEGFYSTLELGDSGALREFTYTSALGYLSQNVTREQGGYNGKILQTFGFVLGVHTQAYPDFSFIYTTTPFGPGFSGGPLVDKDNKVVGLATVEGRAINLALPINEVKPFLKEAKQTTFKQLLDEDRDAKEAMYYRGNFHLYALGDPDRASKHFQKALAIDPDFTLARYDLAMTYRDKGKIDQAISEYEKVVRTNPRFPEALSNLGGYYFRQGEIEKAAAQFKQAIKIYPNFIQALSNLGAVLNKMGKPQEAVPYLRKTLSLDPEFAIAHYNLGNSQFALNQLNEARKSYETSVRLGVDFLSLHWKLYEIHHRKGEKPEAARELNIILQIDPQNKDARRKLAELSSPTRK